MIAAYVATRYSYDDLKVLHGTSISAELESLLLKCN